MTCVLSMPALYTNHFSEGGADVQNNGCESFDFNWINVPRPHSGLSDNQICPTSCHIEASTSSLISCQMEISSVPCGSVKHGQFDVHTEDSNKTDLKSIDMEKDVAANGKPCVTDLFEVCNKTDVELGDDHMHKTKHGVKRKAEVTESEEVYIPSKRVSPFLNTPKERKDERKKILKMSIKKLKQLDDPEAFLRRTVLVNNITKRLQKELRQEKLRNKKYATKKRKSFSGYDVPTNNCMSDAYLFDDPFLSGIHEKITDDMTDTLIKNVFHDKTNDQTEESDEMSDTISGKMEDTVMGEQSCVDSRTFTPLNVADDNSNNSAETSSDESTPEIQSSKECSRLTCLGNIKDTQQMSIDISAALNVARGEQNFINTCHDNSETEVKGERDTNVLESIGLPSSEVQSVLNYQNTGCDKLHLAKLVKLEKSTDIQINCTDTFQNDQCTEKCNLSLASQGAINECYCSLHMSELDQKLDQKTLLHSFNTFSSYTEL
ncbi:uncharacterized protein LOC123538318 [Mercenaria mercenaria]|uniref:uncharacterized protein LOC123538318 n=1 Tax=Mercenaria mercenaria TaxID=6596 RepID=UPI00234F2AF8|nr:uncharacterized protein LOC123538318 [Mercenaria mercenaria]